MPREGLQRYQTRKKIWTWAKRIEEETARMLNRSEDKDMIYIEINNSNNLK